MARTGPRRWCGMRFVSFGFGGTSDGVWSVGTLIGVDRGLWGDAAARRARAGRSGGRVAHRVWTSPFSHCRHPVLFGRAFL